MTLIYGVATSEIGFLVGDTLVSFDHEYGNRELMEQSGPVNGEAHVLKIHVLDPNTAVAFTTGDVWTTLRTIQTLQRELGADASLDVSKRLLDCIRPGTEYLVLKLCEHEKLLTHITTAGVRYCERAYIGDAQAHSEVSKLRKPRQPPQIRTVVQSDGRIAGVVPITAGEREFDEISDAVEGFLHRRSSRTVGGIIGCSVRVVDARLSGKLEYMQAVEAGTSPEEGLFGYTLLASNSGQARGIGLYFRGGKFGFIFVSGEAALSHKEYAETIDDFIRLGGSRYGLRLEGGLWFDHS